MSWRANVLKLSVISNKSSQIIMKGKKNPEKFTFIWINEWMNAKNPRETFFLFPLLALKWGIFYAFLCFCVQFVPHFTKERTNQTFCVWIIQSEMCSKLDTNDSLNDFSFWWSMSWFFFQKKCSVWTIEKSKFNLKVGCNQTLFLW